MALIDFACITCHSGPPRLKVKEIIGSGATPTVGQEVTIKGWVRTIRTQKTFSFIEVNDGSTLAGLQVVADVSKVPGYEQAVAQITTGAAVGVVGVIKESPGKGQALEVSRAKDITTEVECGGC